MIKKVNNNVVNISSMDRNQYEIAPCQEALRFFTTKKSNAEITQKINSLYNEQKKVEEELRKEVRKHYRTFLYTNKEIEKIGNCVSDLKFLVEDTIELVKTLKSIDIKQDPGSGRYNKTPTKDSLTEQETSEQSSTATPSPFPAWVLSAPETIDRLIVQQQFQQATDLVLNVRKYRKGVDENFQKLQSSAAGSAQQSKYMKYRTQYEALMLCCDRVDQMVQRLVDKIATSLLYLAQSQLWGMEEHAKRLKLLVNMGAYQIAAHAFCDSQRTLANRTLNIFQHTGDSLEYVSVMSEIFFGLLVDACSSFVELFQSKKSSSSSRNTNATTSSSGGVDLYSSVRDPVVLTYLQEWVQDQIVSFLKIAMTQIRVGVNEKASNIFIRLRSLYTISAPSPRYRRSYQNDNDDGNDDDYDSEDDDDDSGSDESSDDDDEEDDSLDKAVLSAATTDAATANINAVELHLAAAERIIREEGPHVFLSKCLNIMCAYASRLDSQFNIQGKACVCLHIMPELQRLINSQGDAVIKEISHWISINQTDEWKEHEQFVSLTVIPPTTGLSQHRQQQSLKLSKSSSTLVPCISYDWMVLMLSQYIHDIYFLFNTNNNSTATTVTPISANTRTNNSPNNSFCMKTDISESEATAVASILRVIIRFSLELESTGTVLSQQCESSTTTNNNNNNRRNTSTSSTSSLSMSKQQQQELTCFINNLKAVVVHLIPSVYNCLTTYFSNSSINNPVFEDNPPQVILQVLCQRLQEKGRALSKLLNN